MEVYMEEYLKKHFEVESKNPSEEALLRWRKAVWLVKNPRRRFRMVADLAKRAEDGRKRQNIQVHVFMFIYVHSTRLFKLKFEIGVYIMSDIPSQAVKLEKCKMKERSYLFDL